VVEVELASVLAGILRFENSIRLSIMSAIKILINAALAKLGGAVTYIKAVARELNSSASPHEFLFVVISNSVEVRRCISVHLMLRSVPTK